MHVCRLIMTKTQWQHLCRYTHKAALQKKRKKENKSRSYSLQCVFPAFVWSRRKTCLTSLSLLIITLLSSHQSISFFSQVCLSVSQKASRCALLYVLYRISACEAELISQSQIDVSLTPPPHLHRSRLNTKRDSRH